MRLTTQSGRQALVAYCANVHPGETLADVLAAIARFAGPVRRALGVSELGLGLWLSRKALSEVRAEGVERLRDALAQNRLFTFTLNGFPYGNFQAEVVKRAVYHPDLGTVERRQYLLELAATLAELLPDDVDTGTISTLPLGHREEAAQDLRERAVRELVKITGDLARLRDRTRKQIRICLEPEPGCLLETTSDAIEFFSALPAGIARDHLGLCFDTCHQAVAHEDPDTALGALSSAGISIGKVQLSSALVADPDALGTFDEPRFLHQVRTLRDDGTLAGADDLPLTAHLPRERPWRVHFHVPIHREVVGSVSTTRAFLSRALDIVAGWQPIPHLEVETYTWSVLPEGERPNDDASLVAGLAAELGWVRSRIA